MKIETLRSLLTRQPRVKLFITADTFGACCYVSKPKGEAHREGGPSADPIEYLATDSMLRVDLATGAIDFDAFGGDGIALSSGTRFTRRIQTHRRHLEGRTVPEDYFRRATDL